MYAERRQNEKARRIADSENIRAGTWRGLSAYNVKMMRNFGVSGAAPKFLNWQRKRR